MVGEIEQFLIGKKALPKFLECLMPGRTVVAPVEREGRVFYQEIAGPKKIKLGELPMYPPKKFLLPLEETLLVVEKNGGFNVKGAEKAEKQVIFGLPPCDLAGIDRLDRFFGKDEKDPYYLRRREKTLLISTDCKPCEQGFCSAFGIDMPHGFDLHFSEDGNNYRVFVGSKEGKNLVEKSGLFEKAKDAKELKRAKPPYNLNAIHLLKAMEDQDSFNSKIWRKVGKDCFGCTSCTMVCPSCTCFDFREDLDYEKKTWKRTRVWDSCTEHEFTRVAKDHVFRDTIGDRQKQRMYCKLSYSNTRYGVPTCVGCGRCITHCTKAISIRETAKEITGKWMCTNLGKESSKE